MRAYIVSLLIIINLLVISPGIVNAQKTQTNEQAQELYYSGMEMFHKGLFGSSTELFEKYLASNDNNVILKEQAEVFVLMNHVKLDHYRADYDLEQYIDAHPENSVNNIAIYTLGNYYFNKRKFKKAGRLFEELDITNLPHEYWEEAHFKMGYSFLQLKDFDQAKDHFNQIRNKKGEYYVEANYYYGYICYRQMDYSCALQSFQKIEGEGPAIMNLYIAQIYYAQKSYDQAINHTQKHFDEKYANEFNLVVGKSYFQQDKFKEASSYFEKVEKDFLLNEEELYQFGFSSFNDKKYKEATTYFVQISGANSALGQLANYQLGQSFLKLGDKEQSLAAFAVAKGMSHHKEIAEVAHFNYAKLAFELGRNDAIVTTTQFIELYPNSEYNDPAKGMLAKMFLNTNNYAQAIRILDEIKKFDPATKEVYQKITYLRGEQLFADGDYATSSTFFKKSLRFPDDKLLESQAYYWLGEIDFQTDEYKSAIAQFNKYVGNPGSKNSRYRSMAYYNIGYCYYLLKDYSTALNYFSRYDRESSYKLDPERYMDNSLRLGDSYFLRTQYAKALEAYKKVSDKRVKGADYAIYQQGIIHGLMRKPETKINLLKTIASSYPNSVYKDDALFEIGNTYLQDLDDPDQALTAFNQIISTYDSSVYLADAYVKLGLIYYQKGQDEKALEYCKKVVSKFPRTSSSQEALALIEAIYVKNGEGGKYLDYIANIPNSNIRITYQDSLLYESALRKYRSGDCDAAMKGFDDYISRFSKSGFFLIHANYYKAECANSKNQNALAQKHYGYVAAQSTNEFSEDAYFKLAESYFEERRYDRALPYYSQLERIANSKDNFVAALVGQMRCNYALGNLSAAKKNAVDILPIENVDKAYLVEANLILGKIHLKEGNLLSAEFSFDYVRKESKTEKGAEAQYLKCTILFQQEKYKVCQDEIFNLNDDFASYEYWVVKGFVLLSDVYVAKKDYFNARATLKSILDFYEGDQTIIDECNTKLKRIDELEKGKKVDSITE